MKTKILMVIAIVSFLFSAQVLNSEQVVSNEFYVEKGNEHAKNGRYEDAIVCYIEALRGSPDDAQIHYNLGVAYGNKGILEKEIQEYKKVLEINPGHINAYYNLGIAYGNIGKWDMSFNAFKQLVKLQPKDSDAHYNLALIGIILQNKIVIETEYMILEKIAPYLAIKIKELMYKA